MSRVLLALALLSAPAFADTPITLVSQKTASVGTVKATVDVSGANIDPAVFAKTLLDCANYPMTATYLNVPALTECTTLEGGRGDGRSVIYQRTGAKWPVSERQYVIALKIDELSADKAVVSWGLVQHQRGEDGTFSGPWASTLNKHPDAVYTPYNTGSWTYDKTKGTVVYTATSDPGGSIPSAFVSESAAMAFPKELLRVKFGVVVP